METVRGKWVSFSVSTKHYFEIYVRNSFWKDFGQIKRLGIVFYPNFQIFSPLRANEREFRKLTVNKVTAILRKSESGKKVARYSVPLNHKP